MGLDDSSRLDLSFLGHGGRTVGSIESEDMQVIKRFAPRVVILMVGGNDLTSPIALPPGVASDIPELALSIAAVQWCVKVLVGAIPPRQSYPLKGPAYPERVDRCNFILRNLLQVEENAAFFKIRGLIDPVRDIHIRDGIHFKPYGPYRLYRAVRGAVCSALNIVDGLRGGKLPTQ